MRSFFSQPPKPTMAVGQTANISLGPQKHTGLKTAPTAVQVLKTAVSDSAVLVAEFPIVLQHL